MVNIQSRSTLPLTQAISEHLFCTCIVQEASAAYGVVRLDATEALAPHDAPFRVADRLIGDEDVGTVLAPCGDEAAHDEQRVIALVGKVLHLAVNGGRQRDSGPVEVHRASIGSRCGNASDYAGRLDGDAGHGHAMRGQVDDVHVGPPSLSAKQKADMSKGVSA